MLVVQARAQVINQLLHALDDIVRDVFQTFLKELCVVCDMLIQRERKISHLLFERIQAVAIVGNVGHKSVNGISDVYIIMRTVFRHMTLVERMFGTFLSHSVMHGWIINIIAFVTQQGIRRMVCKLTHRTTRRLRLCDQTASLLVDLRIHLNGVTSSACRRHHNANARASKQ